MKRRRARELQRRRKDTGRAAAAARPGHGQTPPDRAGAPQGAQPRKLAMIRRPVAWLFSGWNCVPTMVSRPTTAVTGRHTRHAPAQMRRVADAEMVGMDEIGVVAGLDPVEDRVGMVDHQIVPAHMRDLQAGIRRAGSPRPCPRSSRNRRSPRIPSRAWPASASRCRSRETGGPGRAPRRRWPRTRRGDRRVPCGRRETPRRPAARCGPRGGWCRDRRSRSPRPPRFPAPCAETPFRPSAGCRSRNRR